MIKVIAVVFLVLTGCSSKEDPLKFCQKICKDYLNTEVRIGNVTNVYSCSCDNR